MTDSTLPVWLLDVDGIVNAIGRKPDPSVWPRDQWVVGSAQGWPILAATPVLDFIRAVHSQNLAEIRWHTTWQETAQGELTDLLGLPLLPVMPCPEFHSNVAPAGGSSLSGDGWWKLPAALRVVHEEKRQLIWTDDDLEIESRRKGGLQGLPLNLSGSESTLLLSPRMSQGLGRRHLRMIAEFLNRPDLTEHLS
jgi:hypothetical protein